ncbi:MAG: CerR family C-terminal domain-containing protein [Planctomycetia bacterium]|nr:CerR family C-terminal domain-containing protein [Planctomycetia bacterium]
MDDSPKYRLLDAAGAAFAQLGFAGAAVRDICQAAGLNIASVNYYFGDKERLYAETVKYACEKSATKYPMPQWPEKTPAWNRLQDFITTFVNRLTDPENKPWQTQIIMREMAQPSSACLEWIRDYVQPLADTLKSILAELSNKPVVDDQLYCIGFSIVGQCLYYRQNRPIGEQLMGKERFSALTPQVIAQHICNFTGAALGLTPPLLSNPGKKVIHTRSRAIARERRL